MDLDPAWRPLRTDPAHAALFVDFDGSIAPIVPDPARAVPLPAAVRALGVLGSRLGCVAVVTGRPVAYVRRYLPDPVLTVVGQYGLERDDHGTVVADPRAARYEPAVATVAREAEGRWPALIVERKGTVAVTLHWRTAPGDAPAPGEIDALATAHGLAAFSGRMSCELRPPIPVDKGTAVTGLLAQADLHVGAFAGDDHGDLAAFDAIARWAQVPVDPPRSALRVAVSSPESPPALLRDADLVLDGPTALAAQLAALVDALDP